MSHARHIQFLIFLLLAFKVSFMVSVAQFERKGHWSCILRPNKVLMKDQINVNVLI